MNSQLLASLLLTIKNAIRCFRIQDFLHGQRSMNSIVIQMNEFLTTTPPEVLGDCIVPLSQNLQNILDAQQRNDTVLLADLLEIQLLPSIDMLLQESVLNQEPNHPDYLEENLAFLKDNSFAALIRNHIITNDYSVELTNLGNFTVKYNGDISIYYHSNVNPIEEGNLFASYYGTSQQLSYTVLGFGFGYHIDALLKHDRRYKITVIESNLDMLKLAFTYCRLQEILSNSRLSLHYCEPTSINRFLSSDSTLLIHYPSFQVLPKGAVKDALHNYFLSSSTMYAQGNLLCWNFYDNIQLQDSSVDAICSSITGKDVLYIGGGPSLEYYLDKLREISKGSRQVIICASTVYRNLIKQDIIPDYVMMIDPQPHMLQHIKDIPETKTALLYLSTAASAAVQSFQGTRYCLYQKDYPDANAFAVRHHYTLFETGGSVSTLALDFALRFRCRQLTTIGLDLGYTDLKKHSFEKEITIPDSPCKESLLQVKGVTGSMIFTTHILNSYRLWIEKRLQKETSIPCINLSNGAWIEGMENRPLADV